MTTEEKIKVVGFLDAVGIMSHFLEHDVHCEIDQCDVCTCGMSSAKNQCRKAYEECLNLVTSSTPSTATKTT